MIKSLRTAASGMSAQQMNVDVIANNLANVNTTGYKKSKIEFQDILYQRLRSAGSESAAGSTVPIDLEVGYGTRPVATQRLFSMGSLQMTGNPLDLSIEGNGFFQVLLPDGTIGYTRDGSFKLSADGQLVTSDGFYLQPGITLPADATDINVSTDGIIAVLIPGESEPQEIGQIELAKFINPSGLQAIGHNLFTASVSSGEPVLGTPSLEGLGRINQGYLEMSNVDIVEEMVNMIIAQRAYEINSKAIQTSEEMSQIANNLKR
ncbi:MAG: flagellar basal body rod protein FlgG [candidate division Zixibacteria bacterium 4484_95]|nr:MAG: flagellar basal body rod protein FlgG [candidate division Zixibacteria bacterium 4484_95]